MDSLRDEAISTDIYTATRGCRSEVSGAVLDECFQEPRDSEVVRTIVPELLEHSPQHALKTAAVFQLVGS